MVQDERFETAAAAIRDCRRLWAARGGGVVTDALAGAGPMLDWRHYPEGEVYDSRSHVQYFFHRHPAASGLSREHGHFHIFLRAQGMPPGMSPLLLPELAIANAPVPPQAAPLKRGLGDDVSHIVAIGIDIRGEPIRLFTTNRWVTGETWYRAEDIIRMLDRLSFDSADPPLLLNRWIGAVICLFRTQIQDLLRARDETVMAWRRRRRGHVFDDPRLEITSSLDIDIEAQLEWAETPFSPAESTARASRLPQMAEGWG